MTFLREIWDKKAAKREVEVTTRKEYEEKVSSLRNGIDYGVTVNNDVYYSGICSDPVTF